MMRFPELGRSWSWSLLLGCAACTVVSTPSAVETGDAAPDATAADGGDDKEPAPRDDSVATRVGPKREPCAAEGRIRCAGGGRQRERCQAGYWTPSVECSEGEVCSGDGEAADASCLGVAGVCRGSPGAIVCDGQGVMYRCGPDGVIKSSASCPSARHCWFGIDSMSCAACLPGEFRCQGDKLERCDAGGQSFVAAESCAAGSCDAEGGRCRGASCSETRSLCRGDVLQTCDKGARDFHEVARCGPGQCDAIAGACDRCAPGVASCESDTALRCSADGSTQEHVDCAADGAHCVGAGRCVRCARDADCDDPGGCMRAYCNIAKGSCEPQQRIAGSTCADGVCSADGKCLGCLRDEDCPAPGDCQMRHCDAAGSCKPQPAAKGAACGGAGRCDGMGHCAACTADGDCPEAPACQLRKCDMASGTCKPTNVVRGTKCQAGVCDGSGKCSGCNADADCPAAGVCQAKHCDTASRTCDPTPVANGTACSGAFGAGGCLAGRCVQCIDDGDCSGSGVCQEAFCRSADNSCQLRPKSSGTDCAGGKVCDGAAHCVECTANAHCGANAVCLTNACHCTEGFAKNPNDKGCNFNECAKFEDNRCGVTDGGANSCTNTVDGYDCGCGAGWKVGNDQCFKGGSGTGTRTVPNGASWNVIGDFGIVCENAFGNAPCNPGQLTWLTVCGLPDTKPQDCSSIWRNNPESLGAVSLMRVDYNGSLEAYGDPPTQVTGDKVFLPAVGNVILIQSVASLQIIRIAAVGPEGLTYEWAELWRDTCWRQGGRMCTAACGCPGGN
ncbi:MAG TPA: hypothetical protein VJV78_23700 [Polyangiales bacterium]|nr:hypothetical protein [Polyangiales bacterium]